MRPYALRHVWVSVAVAVVAVGLIVGPAASGNATTPSAARGFDGSTITVGGLGGFTSFPKGAVGAEARFKRFNDDHEIKGITIKFTGYENDTNDPASALSVGRKLVENDRVFAVVPTLSSVTPGEYFTQRHVPWFGWGIDKSYCSAQPSKSVWGFSWSGCSSTPQDPKTIPATGMQNLYGYVSKESGKKKPTIAIIGYETTRPSIVNQASAATGAGFDVVYAKGIIPPPPVGDVTPYVQALLTSDHGHAPDAIFALAALESLTMYTQLQASEFKGTYASALYSDVLIKPLDGSLVTVGSVPFSDNTPAQQQMERDVKAVSSTSSIDTGIAASYFASDAFITALKAVKKQGLPITPENVQKAASTSTFGAEGLYGPTKYPASTQVSTPACGAIVKSDGTAWQDAVPYRCSTDRFKVLPKFTGE